MQGDQLERERERAPLMHMRSVTNRPVTAITKSLLATLIGHLWISYESLLNRESLPKTQLISPDYSSKFMFLQNDDVLNWGDRQVNRMAMIAQDDRTDE